MAKKIPWRCSEGVYWALPGRNWYQIKFCGMLPIFCSEAFFFPFATWKHNG